MVKYSKLFVILWQQSAIVVFGSMESSHNKRTHLFTSLYFNRSDFPACVSTIKSDNLKKYLFLNMSVKYSTLFLILWQQLLSLEVWNLLQIEVCIPFSVFAIFGGIWMLDRKTSLQFWGIHRRCPVHGWWCLYHQHDHLLQWGVSLLCRNLKSFIGVEWLFPDLQMQSVMPQKSHIMILIKKGIINNQ